MVETPTPPQTIEEAVKAANKLENSFVHPHWLAVDSLRGTLLVSGEHTGNVGIVDTYTGKLAQVIPVSIYNPAGLLNSKNSDCAMEVDEVTGLPTPHTPEPHLHGLQINPSTGAVYLSDEGGHCFYESVIILKPSL